MGQYCRQSSNLSVGVANLGEDHGRNLLGRESLGLLEVLDLDHGLVAGSDDLERPGLDILLDDGIVKATANETPATGSSLVDEFELIFQTGICSHWRN